SPHNDYHFPFISKSAFSHFGLSMDEIQYDAVQVLLDKIEPSDSEEFFKSVEECRLNHQPWHHEFRVNIPQGQRWMRGIATVEPGEDGLVNFYGRVADITEDRNRDEARKLSEQRYQFALDASTKGVWDLNMVTN